MIISVPVQTAECLARGPGPPEVVTVSHSFLSVVPGAGAGEGAGEGFGVNPPGVELGEGLMRLNSTNRQKSQV